MERPDKPAPGHSAHGEAFEVGPRRGAVILPGMGEAKFPVVTQNEAAQPFINQGVAQLHSFYYFEAERSFRQAAKLDPKCVMAYWGMAMANVNNPGRAKSFVREAAKARTGATITQREALYIKALEALYSEGDPATTGANGWISGLEAVVQAAPGDLDARAWLALAIYMGGEVGSRQAVDTLLETVLEKQPKHPGAHHYRIHLWDHQKAERALNSAFEYAETSPGIAHAWHMPGHTYTELHRYEEAALHQEASARVDHAAMLRDRTMPFEIHNYAHNNQWLCTSLGHVGRARDAIAVARNLVEQPRDPEDNREEDGGSAQRNGRLRWAETLIRFEMWDDLIAAIDSGAMDWSDIAFERVMRSYCLGLAHAAKGERELLDRDVASLKDLVEAEKREAATKSKTIRYEVDAGDVQRLDKDEVAKQIAEDLKANGAGRAKSQPRATAGTPEGGQPHGKSEVTATSAYAEIRGYQQLAQGDVSGAFASFAKASSMKAEARARAHLKIRNYAFAETTAKAAVERAPGEVVPLAVYVEVLHAVAKDEQARQEYEKLARLAVRADVDLAPFRRLRPIVESWGGEILRAERSQPEAGPILAARVAKLGPLTWSPYPSPHMTAIDCEGRAWQLGSRPGRSSVVLFNLGGGCIHCMQQLEAFGERLAEFSTAGIDILAVTTDTTEAARKVQADAKGPTRMIPLIPDPAFEIFKSFDCYDEFEGQTLHGVFLIDGRGGVRFRRISAEPFLDVDFILKELKRVGKLKY